MFEVLISDEGSPGYLYNGDYFADIDNWAQDNIGSNYLGYSVQDVSDASYRYNEVACYQFKDEASSTLFILRWS